MAMVTIITSRTKRVMRPSMTFLFSILPASLHPKKGNTETMQIITSIRHNCYGKLVLCAASKHPLAPPE
jgi:hypothetical protein